MKIGGPRLVGNLIHSLYIRMGVYQIFSSKNWSQTKIKIFYGHKTRIKIFYTNHFDFWNNYRIVTRYLKKNQLIVYLKMSLHWKVKNNDGSAFLHSVTSLIFNDIRTKLSCHNLYFIKHYFGKNWSQTLSWILNWISALQL